MIENNESNIYTAITFAPVQSFIEKSRKLRDLYGSSFLLSYLAKVVCDTAKKHNYQVISPAPIDMTQGTPNQIIIKGDLKEIYAKFAFDEAWKTIVNYCRNYIEKQLPEFEYSWRKYWNAWATNAWEFFHAQGKLHKVEEYNQNLSENEEPLTIITYTRRQLNQVKFARNWVGVNWQGESSNLSGTDAIAYPEMGSKSNPIQVGMAERDDLIEDFYEKLSEKLGEKIIDKKEYLNIPELVKRLITLDTEVLDNLQKILERKGFPAIETPQGFKDLNRQSDYVQDNRWTVWFQGDGDSIGSYLRSFRDRDQTDFNLIELSNKEEEKLGEFSEKMLDWGNKLDRRLPRSLAKEKGEQETDYPNGKIIYSGGDDFLGVLYRNRKIDDDPSLSQLDSLEVLDWFYQFPQIWQEHGKKITVSVGIVWAGHSVPQRDVLQHCRETEKLAKKKGKNRVAIRILFNGGNYIDWVCPWWFLKTVLTSYTDRQGGDNWTHFYNDVNTLESRHAFDNSSAELALSLFEIYFGKDNRQRLETYLYGLPKSDDLDKINEHQYNGILGNYQKEFDNKAIKPIPDSKKNKALNNWVINLAKVGFHLFSTLRTPSSNNNKKELAQV